MSQKSFVYGKCVLCMATVFHCKYWILVMEDMSKFQHTRFSRVRRGLTLQFLKLTKLLICGKILMPHNADFKT